MPTKKVPRTFRLLCKIAMIVVTATAVMDVAMFVWIASQTPGGFSIAVMVVVASYLTGNFVRQLVFGSATSAEAALDRAQRDRR